MNIPCITCVRQNECQRDRRCNCPKGLDHALTEAMNAIAALKAATTRLEAADAALQAAFLIHKSQQP